MSLISLFLYFLRQVLSYSIVINVLLKLSSIIFLPRRILKTGEFNFVFLAVINVLLDSNLGSCGLSWYTRRTRLFLAREKSYRVQCISWKEKRKRKVGKGADRRSTLRVNLTLLSRWCLLQHFYDRRSLIELICAIAKVKPKPPSQYFVSVCRAFTIFCKSNVTLSHGHDHGWPILSSRREKYAFRRYSDLFVTILTSLVLGILIGTYLTNILRLISYRGENNNIETW